MAAETVNLMSTEIKGKSIILRPQREEDAPYFTHWFNQPDVMFKCGFESEISLEEEKQYIDLMEQGDKNARNKLIEHNLRLVAHIAKKYENTFEDKDDIISIGIFGLIKAVDSFNYKAKNKLATYAAKCIENEILMHLRSNKNKRNYTWLSTPIVSLNTLNVLVLSISLASSEVISLRLRRE